VAEASKGGIGGWVRSIPVFFRQVEAERAKIAWPSRRETGMTALMVVILTLLLSVFFFVVDWSFSRIVAALLRLAA
jgi:preprotein translocase subunit SecE